jgi:hypothetical protein
MPRRSKGARLWLRKRRGRAAQWVIRDGDYQKSTSCVAYDLVGAERALASYIASKHVRQARGASREPDQIPVADVLTIYLTDVVPHHSRPKEAKGRIKRLDSFFGNKMLSFVTGETCRAYAAQRSTDAAARRELEDLRAAINHHRREGLCNKIVEVVLPPERPPRKRWLTRPEAARLIWSAWRYREIQHGQPTDRRSRQHIARFILVALYTGTRSSAVCGAALNRTLSHGWIDLDRGVFYRRPAGRRETKKRQPPVPLPDGTSAALETAWTTVCSRMEWRAGSKRGQGIRECGRQCRPWQRCDTPRPTTHRRDVADASRDRYVGGGWLSRHDY